MTSPIWDGLRKFKDLIQAAGVAGETEKLDAILDGAMETIADVLSHSSPSLLREGQTAAKDALNLLGLKAALDERSPDFLAGRVSAAVDVLGFAAHQTADDDAVLAVAHRQPYARLLALLHQGALRNVDLAGRMNKDEAQISKWLGALRTVGAVTSHRRGRETFNALTPVGRMVVEQGIEDRNRAPIEEAKVASLDAYSARYRLDERRAPTDAVPAELTRISAAG